MKDARSCFDDRPAEWADLVSKTQGMLHPSPGFPSPSAVSGPRSRHRPDLRRRRILPMGTKYPAQRSPHDQRRRRLHRFLPPHGLWRPCRRETSPHFRGSGRWHLRVSYVRDRNGRPPGPALCRHRRHRLPLERRIQSPGPRLRSKPHPRLRTQPNPLRSRCHRVGRTRRTRDQCGRTGPAPSNERWPAASQPC